MSSINDFVIENGVLTKYIGEGGDVVIPDSVTNIGNWAFEDCTALASIVIPDSVTSIEWSAFENCTSLTSIAIPDSVAYITRSAFAGCTNLTIHGSVGSAAEQFAKENNINFIEE